MAIWVICDPGTYLVTGKLQNAVPSPITMKPSHLKITAHSFLPSRNPWYYVDKDTGRLELDYIQRDLRQPLWKKVRRGPSACCETLEMLTRMPLDLLYEIFSHLQPTDLLVISRTTRWLRQVLMSRDARGVWRSSFTHVRGLPFCPTDMTEPQFASLAFDEYCQFCLAPKINQAIWSCRVRCCRRCVKKQFITEKELELYIPNDLAITRPEAIFPYFFHGKPTETKPAQILYHLPTVERYVCELEDLVKCPNEKALQRWTEKKKVEQAERITHAALCEHWSAYWSFHGSQEFDIGIMVFLIVLLIYLWRDALF